MVHHKEGKCLEVVGGLGLEKVLGRPEIRAGRAVEKQRRESLVKSLVEVDNQLNRLDIDIGIALEIEPGLPFLVRDLDTARRVLFDPEIIERKRIGLNVDIGHLLLLHERYQTEDMIAAQFLINEIKEEKTSIVDNEAYRGRLLPRVMHFHASDHSAGHFCDLKIATYHKPCVFHRYVGLFLDVLNADDRSDYFTGHISVEQEACHNLDQVIHSTQLLRNWIRSHQFPLNRDIMPTSFV